MWDRLVSGWTMTAAAMAVLRNHPRLMIFQMLSFVLWLLVAAMFMIPVLNHSLSFPTDGASVAQKVFFYSYSFAFLVATQFILIFFSSCMTACVSLILQNQPCTLSDGWSKAFERFPTIIGWTLFSASVGFVLQIVEGGSSREGPAAIARRMLSDVLGAAWSLGSFLVVPMIVIEGQGPLDAFYSSAKSLKDTVLEQVASQVGIGVLWFFCSAMLLIVAAFVAFATSFAHWKVLVAFVILAIILARLFLATTQTIFHTVVYFQAARRPVPALVHNSFSSLLPFAPLPTRAFT